ncbi:MAG: hypothetical protein IJ418_08230 [Clostridia bacterium]|nr:hypothetical protein [Clostridia bacterium]
MRDQDKEKPFDAEAYKKNLLGKSHGRVRIVPSREVVSAYMQDQNEVNNLIDEENRRIKRRLAPNVERGNSQRSDYERVIPDAYL